MAVLFQLRRRYALFLFLFLAAGAAFVEMTGAVRAEETYVADDASGWEEEAAAYEETAAGEGAAAGEEAAVVESVNAAEEMAAGEEAAAVGETAAVEEEAPPVSLTVPVPEMRVHCRERRAEFSWQTDPAFYGYRIYETNEEGTTHTLVKKTRKDHWKTKNLAPGKTYYFQLRAYARSGRNVLWSSWGEPVRVKVANDNPSIFSRLRFGGALSVLHADNYGSLEKTRLAVERQFYAVECDYSYSGGVMWCTHEGVAETTGTLEDNVKICQEGGTKIVLDLKADYDEALIALGTYIRDNNLEDWILVQTNNQYAMSRLNEIVGSKLEYWGLVMANYDTVYDLAGNAQTYQGLGMTTVNLPKYVGGTAYVLGTQDTMQYLIDAGYEICVFTWVEFSELEVSNYSAWGARYLMTDNLNQV